VIGEAYKMTTFNIFFFHLAFFFLSVNIYLAYSHYSHVMIKTSFEVDQSYFSSLVQETVNLYGIDEFSLREVFNIRTKLLLETYLSYVKRYLSIIEVYTSEERREVGKKVLEDIIIIERARKCFIDDPSNETLKTYLIRANIVKNI
jgi:hypothetical protein